MKDEINLHFRLSFLIEMSQENEPFYNNRFYQLLTKQSAYSSEILQESISILHEQPELAGLSHSIEGSYFHIICRHASEQEK